MTRVSLLLSRRGTCWLGRLALHWTRREEWCSVADGTVHVLLTDYGRFGWGTSSPQMPELIGGRDTLAELEADLEKLLAFGDAPPQAPPVPRHPGPRARMPGVVAQVLEVSPRVLCRRPSCTRLRHDTTLSAIRSSTSPDSSGGGGHLSCQHHRSGCASSASNSATPCAPRTSAYPSGTSRNVSPSEFPTSVANRAANVSGSGRCSWHNRR